MAKGWTADLLASLGFLTRLPMPGGPRPAPLAEAMRAFPVAGCLIGAAAGLVLAALAAAGLPNLAAAAITLAALALLTGGLHEDGLADMADAFGGGHDRESKLAIMRDSHIGSYGVLALVLGLLAKAAALASLAAAPVAAVALLAASGAFSRALIVWLMASTPPARRDGLAHGAGQPSDFTARTALLIGGVTGLVLLLPGVGLVPALAIMGAGALTAGLVRFLAMRQIGGHTGDICGAVQFLAETAMIAAAAGFP
ncbi:MAG: adenosylcobinamide-GDP ribazoletransferase [Parvibaculaceae bacterium]